MLYNAYRMLMVIIFYNKVTLHTNVHIKLVYYKIIPSIDRLFKLELLFKYT